MCMPFYVAPDRGAKYCVKCLSPQTFVIAIAVAHSSSGVAIYIQSFTDDVLFAYYGQKWVIQKKHILSNWYY